MTPQSLTRELLPLQGTSVVVTGVSRWAGIGYAVACQLAAYGASVLCHHYCAHDSQQPWGADDVEAVLEGIREHALEPDMIAGVHADLREPDAAKEVINAATEKFGELDALVCNQALSGSDGRLHQLTAENLDAHWQVNARASLLLAQAFAAQESGQQHSPGDALKSIVLLTSGQQLGPMPDEVAYATSKAALAGITPTLAADLAEQGIRVNTVNPGPVDTGYLDDTAQRELARAFPAGRLGKPEDPARLIAWLCTDEARWITGQIINTEGGFRR